MYYAEIPKNVFIVQKKKKIRTVDEQNGTDLSVKKGRKTHLSIIPTGPKEALFEISENILRFTYIITFHNFSGPGPQTSRAAGLFVLLLVLIFVFYLFIIIHYLPESSQIRNNKYIHN